MYYVNVQDLFTMDTPVTTIMQTIKTINFSSTVKLPISNQPKVQRASSHV